MSANWRSADCDVFRQLKVRILIPRTHISDPEETVERCTCGGQLKIIAAIEEPAVIERILTHLELSAQPPPRSPARRVELFQAA